MLLLLLLCTHTSATEYYTSGCELVVSFGGCPKNQNCETNYNWSSTENA